MPTKLHPVTTYLTPEEFGNLETNRLRAGLSRSKFLRAVSQGQQIKSLEHEQERMELRRMKGEIRQIGGLLKQAIASGADKAHVSLILRSLDKFQQEIQSLIRRI